jgi:lipase maturation factor 1
MLQRLKSAAQWILGPEPITENRPGHLWPRWIFLRGLGLIYFSAFYSLLFQIKGLLGPDGILPAGDYLQAVQATLHARGEALWYAPSLFWLGSSDRALMLVCWIGLAASVLLVVNLWPRGTLVVCFVCFLSFVTAAQEFSGYQSDGMLLEAGFIAMFFAPPGFWPGLGRALAPSRASLFLLRWEWFRIYFESGVAKMASGDPTWRNFTSMYDYYQNGPLPTWIGWYVQQFPHWFQKSTSFLTLAIELVIVFMLFLPRRFRIACFCIVTPFEISIILTANYTFLNYLVLLLGFLLLDDRVIEWILPQRILALAHKGPEPAGGAEACSNEEQPTQSWRSRLAAISATTRMTLAGIFLGLVFYATTAILIAMVSRGVILPMAPVQWLEPFRIANQYGLFAVMTHHRYEIEFQGSRDGKTWVPYPFRYKPQDLAKPPGIYAPYQPRFEWNLWFASLGNWRENRWVVWTEERLLRNSPDVLDLFASNPFANQPPLRVRAVIYEYWFTDYTARKNTGEWWRRDLLGDYAPTLEREPDGRIAVVGYPETQIDQP